MRPTAQTLRRWAQMIPLPDPSGAGYCDRCGVPIQLHPADEYGDDIVACPDQMP